MFLWMIISFPLGYGEWGIAFKIFMETTPFLFLCVF
jgi:hypothetical protein